VKWCVEPEKRGTGTGVFSVVTVAPLDFGKPLRIEGHENTMLVLIGTNALR
jgi:hypothetical protein